MKGKEMIRSGTHRGFGVEFEDVLENGFLELAFGVPVGLVAGEASVRVAAHVGAHIGRVAKDHSLPARVLPTEGDHSLGVEYIYTHTQCELYCVCVVHL